MLACNSQIQGVGAQVYLVIPGDFPPRANVNFLELARIFPSGKDTLPHKVTQIHHTFNAIRIPNP